DNILEADADLYELLDLNLGLCRFVVASLSKEPIKKGDSLKVASKYTHVTENFFTEQEVNVETIKLNGSVELAPLIDMADAIVDIVETGTTIKENGLTILDEIAQISTRVVVNKASFATKTEAIKDFITKFDKVDLESFIVSEAEIAEAKNNVSVEFMSSMDQAAQNIRNFHEKQVEQSWYFNEQNGIMLGQQVTALDRVGIYVPGGKAAYP